MADLKTLTPLLVRLGELKRLRAAGSPRSFAERAFLRSWRALCGGADPSAVAHGETAAAVAGALLGPLDGAALLRTGFTPEDAVEALRRSYDEVAGVVDRRLAENLRRSLSVAPDEEDQEDFPPAVALCEQPRSPATCPELPRLVLEPVESHGDHCWAVAVYGVLLAPVYGADPADAFLEGVVHHLHNAVMPDAGHVADILIGELLDECKSRLTRQMINELPAHLRERAAEAHMSTRDTHTAAGRAFQAADVLDRVLQQEHYERVSAFSVKQCLESMGLIYQSPLRAFQLEVIEDAGLLPA